MTSAERMKSRLLAQFAGKKAIEGFLEALGEELDQLSVSAEDLKTLRWIDTAFGRQLDGCGDIVGQTRLIDKAAAIPFFGFPGHGSMGFGIAPFRRLNETWLTSATLGDDTYRALLWAKVCKNTTDGTTEGTINSLSRIFRAPVTLTEVGNAKIRVTVRRRLLEGEMLLARALGLVVRAGGVGVEKLLWQYGEDVFGFTRADGSDGGIFRGFGVGRFARMIEEGGG